MKLFARNFILAFLAVLITVSSCYIPTQAAESFMWPLQGRVSSEFGNRVIFGRNNFHRGIDIPATKGTAVHASADGVVSFAGEKGSYGNLVKIKHSNGVETLYGHNSIICVKAGQTVKKGDVIAGVGNTGRSTGPHCHFAIDVNGSTANPFNYISSSCDAPANTMVDGSQAADSSSSSDSTSSSTQQSSGSSSIIPKEAHKFDPRASEAWAIYAEENGWDKDKMLTREWTDSPSGKEEEFHREVGYQISFVEDNVETTRLYLKEDLGMNGQSGATKMVDTAKGEVGTTEDPKGSGKVKYNEWFYGEDADFTDKPWDAVFIAWVANECGFIDNGLFKKTASAQDQRDYLVKEKKFSEYNNRDTKLLYTKEANAEEGSEDGEDKSKDQEAEDVYEIVPGDIIFWKDDNGTITHIGIVSDSSDKRITVIEGDVDDAVKAKTYGAATLKAIIRNEEEKKKMEEQMEDEGEDGHSIVAPEKEENVLQSSYKQLLNGTVVHVEYPAIASFGNGIGSLGTIENAKYIYKFFKQNYNCPDELIAGALGNWNHESGWLDPTSVEGIYNELHTMGPRKQAAMANPDAYFWNLKARTSWHLNVKAYVGRDGLHWPGIGLGGFTGPKATDLMDFAASIGMNWYDLDAQLQYCVNDKTFTARNGSPQNNYNDLFVNPAKHTQFVGVDASRAAYLFYTNWEMPGNSWSQFMRQHGSDRLAKTQKWYNEIKAGNLAF